MKLKSNTSATAKKTTRRVAVASVNKTENTEGNTTIATSA